jgi:hypothetical protein
MSGPPQSVIHVNFIAGPLLFDARPIWTALRQAENDGKIHAPVPADLMREFGDTAIHLGTRHYVMKRAVEELKSALVDIYNLVPEPWSIPVTHGYRVITGDQARDRVLLAVDAFLFEFRSFLELLAQFAHGILTRLGKAPAHIEQLRSGVAVTITDKRNRFHSHAFLLWLCDRLQITTSWYEFLSKHRNFFTHQGAPYCAIEDRMVRPPEFDLLVMRTNIHDFQRAHSSDYFRISECQQVVEGIRDLSAAAQTFLIQSITQ